MPKNTLKEQRRTKLEECERLVQKSQLTKKDAIRLATKVNQAMGRHAKKLLEEIQKEKVGKR